MTYDRSKPYNDLPLLPPRAEIETKAVLKKCIDANKALAELKGAGDLIPNQAILINAIPLQEAKMSSEIENIVTTQDELFRAAMGDSSSVNPATKEVVRYRTALRYGFEQVMTGELTMELLVKLCGIIRNEEDMTIRNNEAIIIQNSATGETIYTPPRGFEIIQSKLQNLVEFLAMQDQLDPLTKMAVSHYQFEAIHPFEDGNGRTGRILNILYLLQEKMLNLPVLYLSRFIIENKQDYYKKIRAVTESGQWEDWILYILSGVEQTAKWTTGRINAIRELFEATVEYCRQYLPSNVYSKELIELIYAQPYCKIKFLVDKGIAKRQAASEYLKEFEKIGVLKGEKRGREVIYKYPKLLEVLNK